MTKKTQKRKVGRPREEPTKVIRIKSRFEKVINDFISFLLRKDV